MKRTEAFNEILGTEIRGVWFDETTQCTVHSRLEQTAKAYKRTRSVHRAGYTLEIQDFDIPDDVTDDPHHMLIDGDHALV